MQQFFLMLFSILFVFPLHANYPAKSEGSFVAWDQKHLELISLFFPDDPIILQAGGHYGNETFHFARHWPKSKIISFEPNPHAFQILSSQAKDFNNIDVYQLALNDYTGTAPFYICYGTSGNDVTFEHASSLLKPSPSMEIHYKGPIIKVDCVLLDQWCQENQIDHVDFLSLDLQGAELQILKSSPEMLKSIRCIVLPTYFFPFRIGTTQYSELKDFLENSGFELFTHWYREGLDGHAIFVKRDYFFNSSTQEYLRTHKVDEKYQRYYEPFFKIYYDIDDDEIDTVKTTLRQELAYEGNIGIIIEQLTKQGSLVLDIGSHIGVHTVLMSRKVGPLGGVIAFEPNRKLYMELLNTLTLNKCNNVICISKALSDCSQTVYLNNLQIFEKPDEHSSGDWVETMTLDSLNLNHVSLIKMDVENYEYFVLKGAKETILKNKPVIIFECWIGADYENSNPKEKANFDRVISLIESYGYEVYVIYSNDFIAFPKETNDDLNEYKKKFKKLDTNNFDLGL